MSVAILEYVTFEYVIFGCCIFLRRVITLYQGFSIDWTWSSIIQCIFFIHINLIFLVEILKSMIMSANEDILCKGQMIRWALLSLHINLIQMYWHLVWDMAKREFNKIPNYYILSNLRMLITIIDRRLEKQWIYKLKYPDFVTYRHSDIWT